MSQGLAPGSRCGQCGDEIESWQDWFLCGCGQAFCHNHRRTKKVNCRCGRSFERIESAWGRTARVNGVDATGVCCGGAAFLLVEGGLLAMGGPVGITLAFLFLVATVAGYEHWNSSGDPVDEPQPATSPSPLPPSPTSPSRLRIRVRPRLEDAPPDLPAEEPGEVPFEE
jgi:hypothetical protein